MQPEILMEALEAISQLNTELYELNEEHAITKKYDTYLILSTDTFDAIVKFMEWVIWNSEDETDRYDEKTDTYIPFYPYLRDKIIEYINELNTLKVKS